MNLRPYLISGKRRSNQVSSSYQKRSVQNHVRNISNLKLKKKQCDSTDQLKPRPYSTKSSHKINLLSKDFLNKQKGPLITATHFLLYDQQNNAYVGLRQDQQRQVASLTKIMTIVVALQLIQKYKLDKNMLIRISKGSSALNGTSANLSEGTFIKLLDLIYGTMLPSGNDAAYLIAEVLGLLLFYENIKPQEKEYNDIESIDLSYYDNTITFVNKFIREMNRKTKELKMVKTNFTNPHGLGNVLNVSTAKDMLILSRYAVQNQVFREVMSTKQFSSQLFEENSQVVGRRLWKNTNKLIKMGWQGVKTGHTPSAGSCLSSLRDGIFIVVLNSLSTDSRFKDTVEIYQWYNARKLFSLKTSNKILDQSLKQNQLQ